MSGKSGKYRDIKGEPKNKGQYGNCGAMGRSEYYFRTFISFYLNTRTYAYLFHSLDLQSQVDSDK